MTTFTYDSIGNMVYKSDIGSYTYGTSTYANPHAPYTVNGVTYTYDNNGNLTTDGVFNHTWNYRNRLTSSGNGTATSTYTYDHTDSRILKGTGIATSTYIGKLYDTFQTFTASTTATTTSYIWLGDSIVATIQTATSTPVIRYTHTDHLGSGNILTDSSGAVLQALDYYPYGEERIDEGNDLSQRTYVGIYSDSDTELLYANTRYYNGNTGQFISQDPVFWELKQNLKNPQTLNSYAYANGNPIVNKDPNGRAVFDISFGGGAILIGGYVGVRVDTKGSYQTYFGTTYGPSVGLNFNLSASSGYLDPTQERQDYVTRDFSVVPIVGFNRSKTAIQDPSDPFDFSNDPQVSYNLSLGVTLGLTQGFRTDGKVQSNQQQSSSNNNSLNTTVSSPTVSGSSGSIYQSLSSSLAQLQAALTNYSASLSAKSQVSKNN